MKKVYFLAVSLMAATTLFSQDSNDSLTFESFDLGTTDYYNGSDENGDIQINDIKLSNLYNTEWSSWSGFAVSKVQDNTTAGFGNQYASFANGGGDASVKYGVFYSMGEIEFNQTRVIHSMQVTNTTYAGISMRDGDAYSKQFGSVNGPDGEPDGTNGEDWFLLQIIALDENDNALDTVDFYLADFRFADDNQDYIVDAWETIQFQNLVAKKLKFNLSSSDIGDWGMNTPSYFAIDNLVASPTVGVKSATTIEASIFPNPADDKFVIKTTEKGTLELFNTFGQLVKTVSVNGTTTVDTTGLPSGMYHAALTSENGSSTQKVVIR